jgi:hypothetical protein
VGRPSVVSIRASTSFEIDSESTSTRAALDAVQRQCRIPPWGDEAGIVRIARDDLRKTQASIERCRRLHIIDRERDVVEPHHRRRYRQAEFLDIRFEAGGR